ncbi:UDP-N-acetylglucosamine--N-acetylmuramyl-(pentapeptide) pyrophosphoryl-undecaprenol N-acetylglucosamine transferase [Synechococcus sp. PCC 7502]|uniref:undecaprenyldiphospho-muramoylpentapeptide beta-N-acetylglucosaminyltransferase n=1 Tax=Synechococcus sp. PCC 7502 TaxID=1173263 RepID=UPI00029FB10C|nr:undecaprenyldiphospho-muramoylpentapeptide beta-N-acetylglucosaminyltransferase [Synechococcus sp. PCC 7502]AFY73138.1 UDP-N-acetylglucosamine--N-acetylmuramyl-(pentapeptide) pyrophosphoryl-undecaprenol N-acetylglucosamine transferase [Synechococcus sp. PCC 7502]
MKKIILTGGGTAGHVTPNIALIPRLQSLGWEVEYIGSKHGIEQRLISELHIPFYGIASGKLRRYFDLQNFIDPFKIIKGVFDAYFLLRKIKPDIIFSKGGFVTVPVILGAWANGIPIIIHESDITPGLANKISIPFATKICVTFPETLKYIPQAVFTGLPIRTEILGGNAERGREFCGFKQELPILLVIGGSSGSEKINLAVRKILGQLITKFQVIHGCGKDNTDRNFDDLPNYKQVEYLGAELADVLAIADVIISRAGANSIFEFLALKKPHLLIPLSKAASRGDQILNAQSFQHLGYSSVLSEEDLTSESLWQAINQLYDRRQEYIEAMTGSEIGDIISRITQLIEQVVG